MPDARACRIGQSIDIIPSSACPDSAHQLLQSELASSAEFKLGFSLPTEDYLMLPNNSFRFAASHIPQSLSWDWRDHGVLTPIKQQGQVRGCVTG